MRHVTRLLAVLAALAMWLAPAWAQGTEHTRGEGTFSRDGKLLAFLQEGRPDREIIVVEVDGGRAFRLVLAEPYADARDLAWAPGSNTLVFVSRDMGVKASATSAVSGPWASTVWSVAFGEDGPQPARKLAEGEALRTPALSADGAKVAWFQPVAKPNEAPPKQIVTAQAFAVFEKDIASGETTRVASSQYEGPRALAYDGPDAWLMNVMGPAYLHENRSIHFWSGNRPDAPPGKGTFDQLTGGVKSFRMVRGETLPGYPEHVRPYPVTAPLKAWLAGVTTDGRPILYGAPGAENTAANQLRNTASWYVDGISRVPMREGFFTFRDDGTPEVLYPPETPAGYHNYPGGFGVDGGMKRYFAIRMRPYPKPGDYGLTTSRLFVFEGDRVIVDREVTDIIMAAERVTVGG